MTIILPAHLYDPADAFRIFQGLPPRTQAEKDHKAKRLATLIQIHREEFQAYQVIREAPRNPDEPAIEWARRMWLSMDAMDARIQKRQAEWDLANPSPE